jgi:ABC-type amino acid transport substrate-binding protein
VTLSPICSDLAQAVRDTLEEIMRPRYRQVSALIAAVMLLGACGSPTPSGAGGTFTDGSLARVLAAKKLVICASNDVPYVYLDTNTGQLAGTDLDIIKATAKRIGIDNLEMVQSTFAGLIPGLLAKRCDVIQDNIGITMAREKQISFSIPQYNNTPVLVVAKGNPKNVQSPADFGGLTVGSYEGTTYIDYLNGLAEKDPTIKVNTYKDATLILADLKAGRLDVGMYDGIIAGLQIKQDPSAQIEILPYDLGKQIGALLMSGIGFRKEDKTLRFALDDATREIQLSGELVAIFNKWGMNPIDFYLPFPQCCKQ